MWDNWLIIPNTTGISYYISIAKANMPTGAAAAAAADPRDLPDPRRKFEEWQSRTPVVTRGIIFILLFSSLFNTLTSSALSSVLECVPLFVISQFEIWRLLTASFFAEGILNVLFLSMAVSWVAPKLERALGSLRFMCLTLFLSVAISSVFCLVALTIAFNPFRQYKPAMIWSVHGLWGIVVSWNAFESTIYPHDTRKLLGLPWRVSTKYHPFVMTALLTFFNFSYLLPIGLLLGLYGGESFMLSSSRLQRMEDDPGGVVSLLLMMSPSSGYVKLSDACGGGRAYADDDGRSGGGSGSGSSGRGSGSSGGGRGGDGSEMYTMESGHVLGTAEAEIGDVPSAVDELLPRNDPAEAAALAAERRLQRQQRN